MTCSRCNTIPYRVSGAYVTPDLCVTFPIQSDNLTYSGPNLPYTGIRTCNTITAAIQKIDTAIGELQDQLFALTSSTTTTTTTTI